MALRDLYRKYLPDPYPALEREAIESADDLPPDRGCSDIAGFEGMPDLTAAEHGATLRRLMYPAQSTTDATPAASVRPAPAMAPQSAPATVSCGSCARFQPGPQPLSIGTCLATSHGLPPKDGSGYKAAFPMAPRRCPEYAGVAS